MKKKLLWTAVGVALLGAAAAYYFTRSETPEAPSGRRGMDGGRPVPVVAAAVQRGDIEVIITALGTVTARNTATVKPRVDGLLQRIT
ncbi:MAG: multidrug transporter subunit MdtA, partial [Betaproteobacteria bacterium]